MTVTRHLALWAACVSVTTAQHYDDTRDGLWHVCSPAWAVPQLDDDSLNADEAWDHAGGRRRGERIIK